MTPRRLIAILSLALPLLACGKVGPPVRTREVPVATSEGAGGEAENGESEEEPR